MHLKRGNSFPLEMSLSPTLKTFKRRHSVENNFHSPSSVSRHIETIGNSASASNEDSARLRNVCITGVVCVCRVDTLVDDVAGIVFVWTPVSVVWEGLLNIATSSGLNQNLMVLYGYVGVFLTMTVVRSLAEDAISHWSNQFARHHRGCLYVGTSVVISIILWKGNCCFCVRTRHSISLSSVWPYGCELRVAFTLMCLAHVVKVRKRYIHLAHLRSESQPQKRSGIAPVLKGLTVLPAHPHVHPQST